MKTLDLALQPINLSKKKIVIMKLWNYGRNYNNICYESNDNKK